MWLIQEWGARRTGTSGPRWIGILLYHIQVPSTGNLYCSAGTPGDVVASGSSLVLPRAAADTRGQHSALRYTGASVVRYAMRGQQRGAQERRREVGTRERRTGRKRSLGLLVVRQQEPG